MDETTETDVIEKIEEEVIQEKIDLKTLEKEMEEVRQNELIAVPKVENIVEPHHGGGENDENTNNEVKDLIESMKQDSDILKNIQSPPTTPPSNSQDDSSVNDTGSDSDTDSIVFDNDDEISLSGFDIQDI